ncbi:MAG: hypothetical protein AAE976_00680 [Thermoplasmataceae archaeon]|jgi:hypothetical protein
MSTRNHQKKLLKVEDFKATLTFVVLYFVVNLSMFTIFGSAYFHNLYLIFATSPISFAENFPDGYPTSFDGALFNGILYSPNFVVPLLIIFLAEFNEVILKSRYPVIRSFGLAALASWIFALIANFLLPLHTPTKGTSIIAVCLLFSYLYSKPLFVALDGKFRRKFKPKRILCYLLISVLLAFITYPLTFGGYFSLTKGSAIVDHIIGLFIFFFCLSLWKLEEC